MQDMELELESEFESENFGLGESESEWESEFEAMGEGPLGEGPMGEFEGLGEGAFGEGPLGEFENEQFLGPLVQGLGGMLGLGESEFENFGDHEGEQFFKKAFKGIGGFLKKAAPILKSVAKIAAPIVGTAIGGPLGGKIGSMAGKLLGEGEGEFESLGEFEYEFEGESEAEMEAAVSGPLTEAQALGELMAAAASKAATDMEAEAQIGSATAVVLSPHDRDTLLAVLPSLNRGVAILTRILRRRAITRPAVRVVPTIVKRTAVSLRKQAASGQPITKKTAARTMAAQTRKVLANPTTCGRAIQSNVKATRAVAQRARTSSSQPRNRRPSYAI